LNFTRFFNKKTCESIFSAELGQDPLLQYVSRLYTGNLSYVRESFGQHVVNLDKFANRTKQPFLVPRHNFLVNMCGKERMPTSLSSCIRDEGGKVIVKHIVRLEDQHAFATFGTVEGLLNLACNASCDISTAKHINPSSHLHYNMYYDPRACEIVARRFAEDFQLFGYDPSICGLPTKN